MFDSTLSMHHRATPLHDWHPHATSLDRETTQVIALSRLDGVETAFEQSRVRKLIARVFGIRCAAGLANPKLEILRRYCVLKRHDDSRVDQLQDGLSKAGYSPAQIHEVDMMIARDIQNG
ncbi:hypothetical protein [Sphingobium sp. CCH11-B1]|uniref:hypothetical protein n=1 Tax=Sphingobium sp. CCH11-B1 TaxID=1768781 RepID=UPI0008373D72|nr:hypothetical protein [Sphingobium sp. CCH11-B1]